MILSIKYIVLTCLLLVIAIVGVVLGPTNGSAKELFEAVFLIGEKDTTHTIIWDLRAPRVFLSMLAGACLGLAGIFLQLSTRSPLGDPNLFGIGGGAAIFLAAVTAGVFTVDGFGVFLGCVVSSVLVSVMLAALVSNRDLTPIKLAIMGIAVGALTVSIGTSVISHGRVFPTQLIGLIAGSFTSSTWLLNLYLLGTLIVVAVPSVFISGKLYPVMLGDTLSKSLGVNPVAIRFISMGIVGVLSGASVMAGGLIGFVGLIAPHVARKMFGNAPVHLIMGSLLVGAIATMYSDQISRLLFAPTELPVGMTTTIIGAPLMMYLAMRMK